MKHIKPTLIWLAALTGAAVIARPARAELPEAEARKYVKQGAVVVDVRTAGEFQTKSLTNVINLPLAEVRGKISGVVTNREQVVLLHCRTGRRSGIAERELRELGYTNAFNIGSFERATKILDQSARYSISG